MTNVVTGMEALNSLNDEETSGSNTEFTSFKTGTEILVKVIGKEVDLGGEKKYVGDFAMFFNYGIFGQINSFVAVEPSKKSARGFPVENLTPWDKAWKYHKDLSEKFDDEHGKEASKYRCRQRYAFGFIDLETGEPIVIDLSRNQAQVINGAITRFGKNLDKRAFTLAKEGSGKNTVVSLTPVLDMDDELTDKQRENFDNAPKEFDMSLFENLNYEADEKEQLQLLTKAGFDITKIGYSAEDAKDDEEVKGNENDSSEISEEDLPF